MNCRKFSELFTEPAIARGKPGDRSLPDAVRDHLTGCDVCARRLEEERDLTRCLDELAREMKCLTAPARVKEQLLLSFRQRFCAHVSPSSILARRNAWLAVAAVVLLWVLGGIGLRLRNRPAPAQVGEREARTQAALPETPLETLAPKGAPKNLPAKVDEDARNVRSVFLSRTRPLAKRNRSESPPTAVAPVPATADTETEIATRFIPLGYAGPLNLQDEGQLVRVELPRSAMLSLGWPVNMDRYGERVKADVLLGPDGLARAIRFVQ